jgi:hypothetical protein
MTTPIHSPQVYALSPISKGQYPGLTASEVTGNYAVQACMWGSVGSTLAYELTRGNTKFFSISAVEAWKAQRAGFSALSLGNLCLQQPHDTADGTRAIDVYPEFRNIYSKLFL